MSGMFYECSSLISLPDILKIDTKNVSDMSWMFNPFLTTKIKKNKFLYRLA